MTGLIQPYAHDGYGDIITPTDVHRWVAQEHSEVEWQARERVLLDQHGDAVAAQHLDRWIGAVGGWTAMCAGTVAVLAFSLTHRSVVGGVEPLWVAMVGFVAVFLTVGGLVAAGTGFADWRSSRIDERVAERALREHHLAYTNRG